MIIIPTRILFGSGQLSSLHKQQLPGKKALIVISNGKSMRTNCYLERVEKELELAGAAHVVFDKVQSNPTKDNVMEGAALARTEACDFIIGLSAVLRLIPPKRLQLWQRTPVITGIIFPPVQAKDSHCRFIPLPVVAITTTAGTGTEVDPWTVITKEDSSEKIGTGWPEVFPVLSVVDPDLMMMVPPHMTAYQGFDALFHSTEGYLAKCSTPMSDIYALKAIELIGRSLAKAVKDGSDKEARAEVALANTLSGMVESTSCCISEHSLEHALSAYHPKLPHGAELIMISRAYYQSFADKHACDERMVEMAKALGKKDAVKAEDFVVACGVDNLKMSDYGIDGDNLCRYVHNARETMGLFALDPVPLDEDECVEILRQSYK